MTLSIYLIIQSNCIASNSIIVEIFHNLIIPNNLQPYTCNVIYLKVFQYSYATLAGDLKQTPPTASQGITLKTMWLGSVAETD